MSMSMYEQLDTIIAERDRLREQLRAALDCIACQLPTELEKDELKREIENLQLENAKLRRDLNGLHHTILERLAQKKADEARNLGILRTYIGQNTPDQPWVMLGNDVVIPVYSSHI
jgi:hypothetical protein